MSSGSQRVFGTMPRQQQVIREIKHMMPSRMRSGPGEGWETRLSTMILSHIRRMRLRCSSSGFRTVRNRRRRPADTSIRSLQLKARLCGVSRLCTRPASRPSPKTPLFRSCIQSGLPVFYCNDLSLNGNPRGYEAVCVTLPAGPRPIKGQIYRSLGKASGCEDTRRPPPLEDGRRARMFGCWKTSLALIDRETTLGS